MATARASPPHPLHSRPYNDYDERRCRGVLLNEFRYTNYAQEIIFGQGAIARLREAVEGCSWRRLLLCATGSLRRDGSVALVEKALGERLVVTSDHVTAHGPDFQVAGASNAP